ncbi:UNVERIFIED_CONTAM: Slc16a12 [Trichonephila clavipes]
MARKVDVPDSARSWAIALAACAINALMSGITRTTGLLYVALIDTYGVSRFEANLPFTMRNIVRCLGGPVTGALGQRFGPRDVTLIGGVFGSLGIVLCTFAPNVIWITILWGGIHGFGVALGNTLSQVLVTQYFVKHRATATGLAFSGSCLGSFVLPVLMEYMLSQLGLSGAFLVTGAILMHVLPFALLLKEPSWIQRETKGVAQTRVPDLTTSQYVKEYPESKESQNVFTIDFKQRRSFGESNRNQDNMEKNCNSNSCSNENGIYNSIFEDSTTNINEVYSYQGKEENNEQVQNGIPEEEGDKDSSSQHQKQETSVRKALIIILSDPVFHMISLSLGAFAMLIDPVFTVIVDFIRDKGISETMAKYFISTLALGDLVGRLGLGWVTDRNYMTVPKFMMMMQMAHGLCFMLMPLIYNLYILFVVTIIFGIITGAALVMFPILIGKYLPTVQSMAIGCMPFFTGLLTLTVPSLIGYFRDEVGSYNGMFFLTGGASVIVGFLWLLEPLLIKLRKKLHKKESAKTTV